MCWNAKDKLMYHAFERMPEQAHQSLMQILGLA